MPYMITRKYKLITLKPIVYANLLMVLLTLHIVLILTILCDPIRLSYRPCVIVHINICAYNQLLNKLNDISSLSDE